MKCRYVVSCCTYPDAFQMRPRFGVAVVEEYDGQSVILKSIADLSPVRDEIERLVWLCNKLDLDPIHLPDVIEDFIEE